MSSSLQNLYDIIGKTIRIKKRGEVREVECVLIDVGRLNLVIDNAYKNGERLIAYRDIERIKYFEEKTLEPPFGAADADQRNDEA